jgi:PleD family two-component response regulator
MTEVKTLLGTTNLLFSSSEKISQENSMQPQLEKILMFDDDPELCERIAENMESQPYEFRYSHDPERDFELIEKFMPQLILLDVGFPYCNGFDILKKIRKATSRAGGRFRLPVAIFAGQRDNRSGYGAYRQELPLWRVCDQTFQAIYIRSPVFLGVSGPATNLDAT